MVLKNVAVRYDKEDRIVDLLAYLCLIFKLTSERVTCCMAAARMAKSAKMSQSINQYRTAIPSVGNVADQHLITLLTTLRDMFKPIMTAASPIFGNTPRRSPRTLQRDWTGNALKPLRQG